METLMTPENYANDWYGHLTNQSGHVLLGVLLFAVLSLAFSLYFRFSKIDECSRCWAFSVVFIGYALWETFQYYAFPIPLSDSLEDTFFVLIGAAFAWFAWIGRKEGLSAVTSMVAVAMAMGAWRRK